MAVQSFLPSDGKYIKFNKLWYISIDGNNYNVFTYADDLLIASTTAMGLQLLIDKAVHYMNEHGLKFNPQKTKCSIYGRNPFNITPQWDIEGNYLEIEKGILYLGTTLNANNSNNHVNKRIKSARQTFYSLQSAGLKYQGVSPETAMIVFCTAVESTLVYGCVSVFFSRKNQIALDMLDRLQSKLIKCVLGLPKNCRTTPLMQALRINPVSERIKLQSLDLIRALIMTSSGSKSFYFYLFNLKENSVVKRTLMGRVKEFCGFIIFILYKYIFNNKYRQNIKYYTYKSVNNGQNA